MNATDSFFDVTKEQSVVKATIIEKYFDAWAGIIIGTQKRTGLGNKIGYIDLFAGPGRYKDNSESTPLKVLQKAIAKPDYAERLVTTFNDKDEANVRTLEQEINALPGVETLKHKPQLWNEEVGDKIAEAFEGMTTIPILAFIDPWGYKGLSLRLVNAFLKDWGCDCIFFFNYNRINMGLSNKAVWPHMCNLFGEERATELTPKLKRMKPPEREATIVEALAQALKDHGHDYVLPFCFKNDAGTRTKHHLILVSKHFKAYEVMKDIMAKSSTKHEQGVPSFTYCPADSKGQALLFELNRPLDDLAGMLLEEYAGQAVTMRQIYEQHSVDRPYLATNYKVVLRKLEDEGQIATRGRKSNRGFADNLVAVFPRR